MSVKIKVNYNNDSLFCIYSKQRIALGQRYAEVHEEELGEIVIKNYLLEYAPVDEDEEDNEPYIAKD